MHALNSRPTPGHNFISSDLNFCLNFTPYWCIDVHCSISSSDSCCPSARCGVAGPAPAWTQWTVWTPSWWRSTGSRYVSQPLPRDQTLYRHWCIDVIYKNGSVCQLPLGILTAATGLWTYWLLHTASPSPYIYGLIDNCWPGLNRDTKCVISIENKLEFWLWCEC